MPHERYDLSAEEMRMTLRLITISAPYASRDAMLTQLQAFGNDARFGIHIAQPDADTQKTTIAAYRSDITFRGTLSADSTQLQLAVYRTFGRASRPAIDHGVNGLRDAFSALPRARFTQTVLVRGDDARLDTRTPISAIRGARLKLSDGQYERVKRRLLRFAEQNDMAASWGQFSRDPRDFAVDLYNAQVIVFSSSLLNDHEYGIGLYRSGDRSATEEAVSDVFARLRLAMEEIDGVTFIDESWSHR